jgi:hypothetical protein
LSLLYLDMVSRDSHNHWLSLNPFAFQGTPESRPLLPSPGSSTSRPSSRPPPGSQNFQKLSVTPSNSLLPSPHYIEFSLINITVNNRGQGGTVGFGGLCFVVSGIAASVGLASESIQHHKEKKAVKKAEAAQREQSVAQFAARLRRTRAQGC